MIEISCGLAGSLSIEKAMTFSGGERQIRVVENQHSLSSYGIGQTVKIRADIRSSEDIMDLLLTVDAIKRMDLGTYLGKLQITLELPYLPYARQDRVMESGEALSIKVMANLINSMEFTKVQVWDVHSDVSLALINNVVNIPQHHFVLGIYRARLLSEAVVVVSPDSGADKKSFKVAQELGGSTIIHNTKIRNTDTGAITSCELNVPIGMALTGQRFLIVDDICDGGKTFTSIAENIRSKFINPEIYLYVTHGIFSKGLDPFKGLIDKIFTANPWPHVKDDLRLHVLPKALCQ